VFIMISFVIFMMFFQQVVIWLPDRLASGG